MRIIGITTSGEGSASGTNKRQIAAAAVYCPAVADCGRFGTINVRLDQPFDKGHADCWTPRIPWKPKTLGGKPWDQSKDRDEEFGFDAWIIFCSGHGSTYFDTHYVEIIASELISGRRMKPDSRCAIHLDHAPSIARPASFGDNWVPPDDPRRLW